MRRVTIIGQPGSGKSTLARALGERIYLPVHHMDHIHWKSGWQARTQEEKARLVDQIIARDAWIFEGNNTATSARRLSRSDTLIWLDLPILLRLFRVTQRSLRYFGQARPDLPEGCREQLDPEFFRYIWRTRTSGRTKLRAVFDSAPEYVTRIRLASAGAVLGYLEGLDAARAWGNLGIPHR